MDIERATQIAEDRIASLGEKYGLPLKRHPNVLETELGWIFTYAHKEFIETGNEEYNMLAGNSPLLVTTTGQLFTIPTFVNHANLVAVRAYLNKYEGGGW